jgi:hypothetical protein
MFTGSGQPSRDKKRMANLTDSKLYDIIKHTKSLLENIGGRDALDEELLYYGPRLRKCFPNLNHKS